mgnify:CR=1 FL=1
MNNGLAGMVILYNPSDIVAENIYSYLKHLDIIYLVDNSEKIWRAPQLKMILDLDKVVYIKHPSNLGISYSINEVLSYVCDTYDWLLTMDQDTKFVENGFVDYYKAWNKVKDQCEDLCVICPYIKNKNASAGKVEWLSVHRAITTGMILNVKQTKRIGGMDENLFIDEVDYEFCYRVRKYKLRIIQYQKDLLQHHIGYPEKVSLGNKILFIRVEKPFRYYYIIRNLLYEARKYPELFFINIVRICSLIVKSILFHKERLNVAKYIVRAFYDFRLNRYGKYKE